MFGKKKSNVPDESKGQGLEFSEFVELIFSFLWFHRGILLFFLVLWGLYHVLTMAGEKVLETKRRDAEGPAFVYQPRPAGNESLTGTGRTSGVASVRQPAGSSSDSMGVVRQPKRKLTAPKQDPDAIRFQKFLATADADSLTRRFTILMQEVPSVAPFEAISNIKNCQKICDRMREMKLSLEQERLLAAMELESASQFDAISTQHEMDIPGVRDRLLVLATPLLNHPETEVSAKSHLAIFAAHAMDLIIAPTREDLATLIDSYEAHVDGVLPGGRTALVMADLLQEIIQRHQFDEVIALRRDMADRMFDSDAIDFDELGLAVKERMIFGDLGLPTLIGRIEGANQTASQDVELFCQRLERFPDSRKNVYQIAFAVVDSYVAIEQFDQASSLLRALQQIKNRIPNPKTKDWLGENILEYAEKISMVQTAQ